MPNETNELKPFLAGLAGAAVAGLLMGAVCRPDLGQNDRPEGPQMMANWTAGPTGPFDDDGGPVIADWKGAPPAYVTGTDALKAAAWPGPTAQAPLPNRDLEPLPKADELQREESVATADAPSTATDTAVLPAPADQTAPG